MPRPATVLRCITAAAAGLLLYASFPPRQLWWLAPIAFGMLVATLHGRRARAGFGYGMVFALAWMLPLLKWLNNLLAPRFGPWPWLGLCVLMAVLIAAGTAAMAVASTLPGAPVWMAAAFIADEALRQRFPADGFPWGRLAFSQPEGAFLSLASIGGAPLLGFAVALAGGGLGLLVRPLLRRDRRPRRLVVPVVAMLLPVLAGLGVWPGMGTDAQAGTVTVAAVQGSGPNIGLRLLQADDALWRTHVAQARRLDADIAEGRVPQPDLVIFPESVVDLRSSRSPVVGALADLLDTPIALGAVVTSAQRQGQNVVIGWDPERGLTGRYAKQKLVPYGEYLPFPAIARWVTPFVGAGSNLSPGTTPGAFPVGPATVGFAICYEVAYDQPLRGAVRAGANLLAVPANNVWYGRSDASYQQLAMARVRAVEHGRAVVVAATTGVSAIVRPDGTLITESGLFSATDLVATVPLRTALTPADMLGASSEWGLVLIGITGVLLGIGRRVRARRAAAAGRSRHRGSERPGNVAAPSHRR